LKANHIYNQILISPGINGEGYIKASVASGISRLSLFYMIGLRCLSVDKIFVAYECSKMLTYNVAEIKEYAKIFRRLLMIKKKHYLLLTIVVTTRRN